MNIYPHFVFVVFDDVDLDVDACLWTISFFQFPSIFKEFSHQLVHVHHVVSEKLILLTKNKLSHEELISYLPLCKWSCTEKFSLAVSCE